LAVPDRDARAFYEQECVKSKWSVKELNRQIGASLFERLLLSGGKANKEKVLYTAPGRKLVIFAFSRIP